MGKLNVNLKFIPDVDGSPKIAQLVGYHLADIALKGAWAGPARLHLVPHVNCRVADLPVRKVLFGRHLIADLTLLKYGEVLLDYLKKKRARRGTNAMSLKGKVALVTGSTSGIGHGIAVALAQVRVPISC